MRRTHFERIALVTMKLRYIRIHDAGYKAIPSEASIELRRARMRRFAIRGIWDRGYWRDQFNLS